MHPSAAVHKFPNLANCPPHSVVVSQFWSCYIFRPVQFSIALCHILQFLLLQRKFTAVQKILIATCAPLSINTCVGMPYGMIQFSIAMTHFATPLPYTQVDFSIISSGNSSLPARTSFRSRSLGVVLVVPSQLVPMSH